MSDPSWVSILGTMLASLVAGLSTVLWWLWRTDRAEQNAQIAALTAALQQLVTRAEVQAFENQIRAEFKTEHRAIIDNTHRETESLRQEFREGVKELRAELHVCSAQILEQVGQLIARKDGGGA